MQDMSKYYRDAKLEVGAIVNSLTMEAVADPGTPVEVVPIKLAQFWGEVPKNRGSGLRTRRMPFSPQNASLPWGDFVDEEGAPRRRRKETDWLFLLPSDIDGLPVCVTFRDTSFSAAKKLNTFAMLNKKLGKPCWATSYELRADETTNDQGTFYVYSIGKRRDATEEEIAAAQLWAGKLATKPIPVETKEEEQDEDVPF